MPSFFSLNAFFLFCAKAPQQAQQLAAVPPMPSMAEDEDMYPNTDAQQYDYIADQPVQYPVPQQVSFASCRAVLPLNWVSFDTRPARTVPCAPAGRKPGLFCSLIGLFLGLF